MVIVAESQVDKELPKVLLGMKIAVWEFVKILKDNLGNNWALVRELLLKFCLVKGGELVLVACGTWQVRVLARVDGNQFAIFKDIFFENFRAKGEQRLAHVIAGLPLPSLVELFEQNAQVNFQALFLVG